MQMFICQLRRALLSAVGSSLASTNSRETRPSTLCLRPCPSNDRGNIAYNTTPNNERATGFRTRNFCHHHVPRCCACLRIAGRRPCASPFSCSETSLSTCLWVQLRYNHENSRVKERAAGTSVRQREQKQVQTLLWPSSDDAALVKSKTFDEEDTNNYTMGHDAPRCAKSSNE